jgi:tetratricopeptide (TPR) repeat protein
MPTKLGRFCLGVMEAAWLAALTIIPIFFDIYSSRIFEPDKITILRSLALLTVAAWAIKLIDEGGIKWKTSNNNKSLLGFLWHYPLLAPIIGLVIVYSISTIFSVTPSISFFGSWQRLQGTYTAFSYLVIFFSILVNLRKREQINRLVTTVILASLPVSLYGLLQRFQIDPIPWGGNVSTRIAANMGNSIFVSAYLIMVFPLTIYRIVDAFKAILSEPETATTTGNSSRNVVRATIYFFIAAFELIAIFMSGSRGPMLGLMAGIYFMVLLFSIYWRKRWLTLTTILLAVLGAVFLAVFNMNNGPLEALRTSSAIGRFGNLLNSESNSALVRQYIWEGTVKLVSIHEPLKFPDGSSDKYNLLRPIIGYGPETMYVAYNQFYQPELGQVEKRNASPDRSHNETWDSIVITGVSGLLIYLAIFSSVFYFGLKWQGLVTTKRNRLFFFVCLFAGGIIGAITLIILKGVEFFGVGLPFGMVIGVILYITISALFSFPKDDNAIQQNTYMPLMIVLFSSIVAHFIEINFGIAIVATRTLFWTYSGLIIVLGFVLPGLMQTETQDVAAASSVQTQASPVPRKKDNPSAGRVRRNSQPYKRPLFGDQPEWLRSTCIGAAIIGIILATLGFDYLTNSSRTTNILKIISDSLTRLPNKENAMSLGILILIIITWIAGILLFATETGEKDENKIWVNKVWIMGAISAFIGALYWIFHAISLALLASASITTQSELLVQVNNIGSVLTKYYVYMFIILFLFAFLLPGDWPSRGITSSVYSSLLAPIALILVFLATAVSNLKVIDADITFKMAEPFTKNSRWEIATLLYQQSTHLTPREDHYYLFLGRSYLEQAKVTDATADQDQLIIKAEDDLKVAQSINPLNTDHTANLARLYSWWAGEASATSTRNERSKKASDYYATALTLSPNNSTLWDEWAVLSMQLLNDPNQALAKLNHALSLDPKYSFTQGLLGDFYLKTANAEKDVASKDQDLKTAANYYRAAVEMSKPTDSVSKSSYLISLGNVLTLSANVDPQNIDTGEILQAISALQQSITAGVTANDLWKVQQAIARLYLQIGDKSNAQFYANQALQSAPDTAINQIQDLITQTQFLP